jgi:hypothetical protein
MQFGEIDGDQEMTKCEGCKQEVGDLLCGKCRAKLKRTHELVPILFYDKGKKGYRAGCTVVDCPWNENGVCITLHIDLDSIKRLFHEFDGDNIVQQACG